MPAGTMKLRCEVCHAIDSKGQHNAQCQHGCFRIANGLDYDAQRGRIIFRRHELVGFCSRYRTYDELVRFCRQLSTTRPAAVPERAASGRQAPV
jgi:hypothetical protein